MGKKTAKRTHPSTPAQAPAPRAGKPSSLLDTRETQSKPLNRSLSAAKAAKQDEFYTPYVDIQKEVEAYLEIDGVWIVHPRCVLPVAMSLRNMLIEVSSARTAGVGQQTKMEMIYTYLTGPKFRLRVQAIVEAFSAMSDDLTKEKKVILKQWAKREEQINRVMEATVGMYGELQGIAGKTLGEIAGLEIAEKPALLA